MCFSIERNSVPSRCEDLQNVRLKHVMEDVVLGRTLVPASAEK